MSDSKISCVLCEERFKQITRTHLDSKHQGISMENYLHQKGAIFKNYTDKELICVICNKTFFRKKAFKNPKCKTCSRKIYNKKKRIKRQLAPPLSQQKRKARFYGTLSEAESDYLHNIAGNHDPNSLTKKEHSLDETHEKWDFVVGSRGRGKQDIGFERIGTITDNDLKIVIHNGKERIKAAVQLRG